MKKINLGLIGLGAMGTAHLHNSLRLNTANVVAVADISEKSLQSAKKLGVKHLHRNYEELLKNPKIDAVVISLPHFLHCESTQKAAEAGKDILLEKPLARNEIEGKQILSAVQREGVKLMIGYPLRFCFSFRRLKSQLEMGTLGDVHIAVATNIGQGAFYHRTDRTGPVPVPSWWFNKELMGGGALLDYGSHMINLLTWYFGDVVDVKSYLGYKFGLDFEDHAVCLLKFEDGPIAFVNVGYFSNRKFVRVELDGSVDIAEGSKIAAIGALDWALDTIKRRVFKVTALHKGKNSPYYEELKYFVSCVGSDIAPLPSGEEGLMDLKIISMAYRNPSLL